jgi:hypothetical protein
MTEVSNRLKAAVGMLISLLVYLALLPTVISQVQDLNTTAWSFTGYAGGIVLVGVIPFVFIASILLAIISDAL